MKFLNRKLIKGSSIALLVLPLVLPISSAPTFARDVPASKAEREGMSSDRLKRISAFAESYVAEQRVAGMITMVARNGKIVHFDSTGKRGLNDSKPLEKDALFRIYSMSKPITAVALMMLYEEGKFQLTDPAHKYIPELKDLMVYNPDGEPTKAKNAVTMQQLLTHTAGFSFGFNPRDPVDQQYQAAKIFEAKNLDEFVAKVAALPLQFEPGTRWHYSVASDLVGLAVERISGVPFNEFLQERIFNPLDMSDTFFNVPADKRDRFLPNHGWDPKSNKMVDYTSVTDARGNYATGTLFSGGGGLVSSTMDYMRFCEMLRNGGSYNGTRLLSPKTIEYMTLNHLPAAIAASGSGETPTLGALGSSGVGFGLGFSVVTDPAATGTISSQGEYAWGGAAGTIFWIDPEEELVSIAMIQLMASPWPLRADMKATTYQAITELEDD